MKKLILILSSILSFGLLAKSQFIYSEAANVFELMDNLSLWHPKTDPLYAKSWERKFGAQKNKEAILGNYVSVRKKYTAEVVKAKGRNIFGDRPGLHGIISEAFYQSRSVNEALKKLRIKLPKEDFQVLVNLFKLNIKEITELMGRDSTTFQQQVRELESKWKKVRGAVIVKKFAKFLKIKTKGAIRMRFIPIWYPGQKRIDARGSTLLLRYDPLKGTAQWSGQEFLDAALKSLLLHQSPNQKRNLTKIFEEKCPGRGLELNSALLRMWGNMLPKQVKEKKKFSVYQKWDRKPFLDVYLKLLFPLLQEEIKKRGHIGGRFIEQASEICSQLHELSISSL